jgi:TrkA domain protein
VPDVSETPLPGVGVRHEFVASGGDRIAVLTHRSGRREISVFRRTDPDSCDTVLDLDDNDALALASLLGAPRVTEVLHAMQRIEGLAIDWVTVLEGSSIVRSTIAEGAFRTRTGVSVVAVVRGDDTIAAPGPEFEFAANDVVVAVGTTAGLAQLRALLRT